MSDGEFHYFDDINSAFLGDAASLTCWCPCEACHSCLQGGYMCGLLASWHRTYENLHFVHANLPRRQQSTHETLHIASRISSYCLFTTRLEDDWRPLRPTAIKQIGYERRKKRNRIRCRRDRCLPHRDVPDTIYAIRRHQLTRLATFQ